MAGMTTNCCSPCRRRRSSSCPSRFKVWVWPPLEKSPASETCCWSKRTVGRVPSLPLDGIPFEKGCRLKRCTLGVYQFERPHFLCCSWHADDFQDWLSPCSPLFLSRRKARRNAGRIRRPSFCRRRWRRRVFFWGGRVLFWGGGDLGDPRVGVVARPRPPPDG